MGRDEYGAFKALVRLSGKCSRYHAGDECVEAAEILELVGELLRDHAGTEAAELARKHYPDWTAGDVPQRMSDLSPPSPELRMAWLDASDRSHELVQKWRFRAAREPIEAFLVSREAALDAADLEHFKGKVDEALRRIDMRAESIFNARRKIAWDHEKKKRYKEAIAIYERVVEKFDIDQYVRKAQDEINRIESKYGKV